MWPFQGRGLSIVQMGKPEKTASMPVIIAGRRGYDVPVKSPQFARTAVRTGWNVDIAMGKGNETESVAFLFWRKLCTIANANANVVGSSNLLKKSARNIRRQFFS